MKVSKNKLQQMIKEEYVSTLEEMGQSSQQGQNNSGRVVPAALLGDPRIAQKHADNLKKLDNIARKNRKLAGLLQTAGRRRRRALEEDQTDKKQFDAKAFQFAKDAAVAGLGMAATLSLFAASGGMQVEQIVQDLTSPIFMAIASVFGVSGALGAQVGRDMGTKTPPPASSGTTVPMKENSQSDLLKVESLIKINSIGENKMKVSKEKLKQMIKEELEKVMKETEQFQTDYDKNQKKKHKDHVTDYAMNTSGEQYDRDEFKADMERDAREKGGRLGEGEELEEIKGPLGARMAALDKIRGGPAPGIGSREAIADVAFSDEEEDDSYEADLYGPEPTKDEEIDDILSKLGIDSASKEGMDLRAAIKAAAEKHAARYSDRRDDILAGGSGKTHGDPLAIKTGDRFQPRFYKRGGKMTKSSRDFAIDQAKRRLGLEEGEEEVQQESVEDLEETEQQMEELEEAKMTKKQIAKKMDELRKDIADLKPSGADDETEASRMKEQKKQKEVQLRKLAAQYAKASGKVEEGLKQIEQKQMEELSESFRRFTKLPKAVLKD